MIFDGKTASPPVVGWAVLTMIFAATSSFVDGFWWTFFLGIGAFIGGSVTGFIAIRAVCTWLRLGEPFKVAYLIPQAKYPNCTFPGADIRETHPERLTVGIGRYRVMHFMTPQTEFDSEPYHLWFAGPEIHRPRSFGRDNPFIVSRQDSPDGVEFIDWHGSALPAVGGWPRHFIQGRHWVIGNRIETYGPWDGFCVLTVPVRGRSAKEYRLVFEVVEKGMDDIPFLKGWSDAETQR